MESRSSETVATALPRECASWSTRRRAATVRTKKLDRLHDGSGAHGPPVVAPTPLAAYNADVGRIRRSARDMGLSGPRSISPPVFQHEAGFFLPVRDSSTPCLTCQTRVPYTNRHMETWKEFEANELTHSA